MDQAEERFCEIEDRNFEIIQAEENKEERWERVKKTYVFGILPEEPLCRLFTEEEREKGAEYISISNVHKTFSRIDPMVSHKPSLNKFKNIEIIPGIFFNNSGLKLGVNYRSEAGKFINMLKFSNTWTINQWIEVQREIQKYLETYENGNTTY